MASDQRKRPRTPISGPIMITVRPGKQIHGQAMDVSLLGFRFNSEEVLAVGDLVMTNLVFPSGRTQVVEGTVKSIASSAPYQYGVVFTEETTERIIREFIKLA